MYGEITAVVLTPLALSLLLAAPLRQRRKTNHPAINARLTAHVPPTATPTIKSMSRLRRSGTATVAVAVDFTVVVEDDDNS